MRKDIDDQREEGMKNKKCVSDSKGRYCKLCGHAMWRNLNICKGKYSKIGTTGYDEFYHDTSPIDRLRSVENRS